MTTKEIIRAWKDEEFRASLSANGVIESPAGAILLDDDLLEDASGTESTEQLLTFGCCTFSAMLILCTLGTGGVRTLGCCKEVDTPA